tara:strand:- start:1284 stop:1586 length:303 start_codon:yes stop_codon:yes gene_type:complete
MINNIINKLNTYKTKISKSYRNFKKQSSSVTKGVYGKGKVRIESEQLKMQLKKYYSQLGLYVARQYILKKHSDFSLDQKFIDINSKIKKVSIELKRLTNK